MSPGRGSAPAPAWPTRRAAVAAAAGRFRVRPRAAAARRARSRVALRRARDQARPRAPGAPDPGSARFARWRGTPRTGRQRLGSPNTDVSLQPLLLIDATGQETAIHGEDFAVHEAGAFGCEEHGGAGELAELAEPLHRRAQQELLAPAGAVEQVAIERGPEHAGRDRVDAHALGAPLDRELAGQRRDA